MKRLLISITFLLLVSCKEDVYSEDPGTFEPTDRVVLNPACIELRERNPEAHC